MFHAPQTLMIDHPHLGRGEGNNGFFRVKWFGTVLSIMSSDGEGWEHVSVSTRNRPPLWEEMVYVKSLFWDDEDCVVQFHPPKSKYVNNCENCLHLWRRVGSEFETPPTILVGIK